MGTAIPGSSHQLSCFRPRLTSRVLQAEVSCSRKHLRPLSACRAGCGGLHNPEGEAAWSSPTGLGDRPSTKAGPARSLPSAVPAQATEEPLCLENSPTSGAVLSAVPAELRRSGWVVELVMPVC